MFCNPFDKGSVCLSIVGNFINDVGSEVRRKCGLRFSE